MNGFRMTLDEIAAATRGFVVGDGDLLVTGIATDSRTLEHGDLFVAIAGETFDGHDFIEGAAAGGAVAALVDRGRGGAGPAIEIDDTFTALRDLAAHHRTSLEQPVVAITGSTGKTTTKDLLAAALPGSWASPRSFNNEVGVPLTVLRTPPGASYAVIEVGSRGLGHIEFLAPAVQPDVAVITNLGTVHLETFGTTDDLATAKFELVEALTTDGVAVLPADEPRLLSRPHDGRTVTFGVEIEATVIARDVVLDERGVPSFVLETPAGSAEVTVPIPGAVQAANAAAAVAAGLEVGESLDVLVGGLANATGSAWRMEVHSGRYVVVNDAYNANPQSVEAALRTVTAMPGRHLAVLGRMAELGSVSDAEHLRIGALARDLGFASVIVVGDAELLARGAGDIAVRVPDADSAVGVALEQIADGDVVLVKASRSIGLEAVDEPLIAASKGAAT
jgi:UDP-N-acetylmuramoyl-tripeptide--D-alanyl-D-alanine ligase